MVVGISKRHQFRNEKALYDLIRTVPGNDRCADCSQLNPGWASWNLGIFICMRCASLHRKLGTHISKVKSLSMDSWTTDQVDSMRSHGNNISNNIYNPRNVKPPVATDADEEDACMERFIRQKYQHRSLEDGKPKPPSRDGSDPPPRSPEGSPPPLPPKTGKLFGFGGLRSSASASNLRRPSSNKTPVFSSERKSSLSPSNTGPQGVGASVAGMDTASFASKLTTLRDMGFPDDRRNAVILKSLSGDLEKTIDSLVRLGEGGHPPSGSRTPATTASQSSGSAVKQEPKASTNPFDQLDVNSPSQPSGKSYNPFDMPAPQSASASAQPQSLESSFQNLQVSQPLFPHSTGGYPPQHSLSQPLPQQSATPPVTSSFTQGSFVSSPQSVDGSYNPFFQPPPPQPSPAYTQSPGAGQNNPFFSRVSPQSTSMVSQTQSSFSASVPTVGPPNVPRHANTMPAMSSTSPFGTSPFQQQQQPQPAHTQGANNPFQAMTAPTTPQSAGYDGQYQQTQYQQSGLQPIHQNAGYDAQYQQPQYQQPGLQPPQPLAPQATGRMNKGSILALYNFSPPPPSISEQPQPQPQPQPQQPNPAAGLSSTPQNPQHPVGGSNNPFHPSGGAPGPQTQPPFQPQPGVGVPTGPVAPQMQQPFQKTHGSQPSVDINGFQNGRHSPDAFASLSARYG